MDNMEMDLDYFEVPWCRFYGKDRVVVVGEAELDTPYIFGDNHIPDTYSANSYIDGSKKCLNRNLQGRGWIVPCRSVKNCPIKEAYRNGVMMLYERMREAVQLIAHHDRGAAVSCLVEHTTILPTLEAAAKIVDKPPEEKDEL